MLDSYGFNLWASDYDKSVGLSDEKNTYPFAGYKKLMNTIYNKIMNKKPAAILDIGIGTATLAAKLYESGNQITGIDFSDEMLDIAREKMPSAMLIKHDFTKGLPAELAGRKFDFIVSTYAIHHLTDLEKASLIISALDYLNENGTILIGDVSFQSKEALEKCKNAHADDWDSDEYYFVVSDLGALLEGKCLLRYHEISYCAGILEVNIRGTC